MSEFVSFPDRGRGVVAEDKLGPTLQESLLALLGFNDRHGSFVAAQVKPEHFSAFYAELARPILEYRAQYHRAPGHAHIDDIFDVKLFQGDKARRYREAIAGIHQLAKGLNAEFVADRTQEFIRWQVIKGAVMRAAELVGSKSADLLQVEEVLYNALKAQAPNVDPGIALSDTERSLEFLNHNPVDFKTGIKVLDWLRFGATKKEMLLYIAGKSTGKSWFCVHMGKQGLIQQAKVLHISNEMSELTVVGRYYKSLFAVATRDKEYTRTSFELDEFKKYLGVKAETVKPKIHFAQSDIRQVLKAKIEDWGLRLGSIVVKEFPSGSLTMPMFERYLDRLFAMEKFAPTMVIVDYPDLMKHNLDNYRLSIGQTFVNLRGSATARNYALVAPTQGGRAAIGAKHVRSSHVTEDISKVFTADKTLTFSRTPAEKRLGYARLFVNHSRNEEESDEEIIISQAYAAGQYALSSAFMSTAYQELMKREEKQEEDEEEEGE